MAGLTTIWEQFLTIAKEEAGSRVVETWLKAVSLYQWDSLQKVAYLLAPNTFVKEWIKSNYLSLLEVHLSRLLHVDEVKVVFVDTEQKQEASHKFNGIIPAHRIDDIPFKKKHEVVKSRPAKNRYHLNKNYLFETFVQGPNSQMAYAAAQCASPEIIYQKEQYAGAISFVVLDYGKWQLPTKHNGNVLKDNFDCSKKERIHQLKVAGAFCAAEIDRIYRL